MKKPEINYKEFMLHNVTEMIKSHLKETGILYANDEEIARLYRQAWKISDKIFDKLHIDLEC